MYLGLQAEVILQDITFRKLKSKLEKRKKYPLFSKYGRDKVMEFLDKMIAQQDVRTNFTPVVNPRDVIERIKSLKFKIASNDLLGSKSKVKKYVNECIRSDQNIVIDNVNHTKKNREEFIKVAKKHGYSVTIIYVDNDINFCYYMNQLRTELSQGSEKLVPKIAYYTIKKRFEIPQASECDQLVTLSNKVKSYEYLFPGLN